jgi:spore maturation protein CgeB
MKKILVVGEFMWPWYQQSAVNALKKLGHKVSTFSWLSYFMNWSTGNSDLEFKNLFLKFEHRFNFGPTINKINELLIKKIDYEKPEIILFYNVKLINKEKIFQIKNKFPKIILCQYSNDNPFVKKYRMWKNYIETIKYFNFTFAARDSDIPNYIKYGAKKIHLLKSSYDSDYDYPVDYNKIPKKYKCDVVFAGHYENDGRLEYIKELCNRNFSFNLYGSGWNKILRKEKLFNKINNDMPVKPAIGQDYRYAICGSKIALCFFSKTNKDYYTRRNFQIPAMRRLLLCEYNEKISKIFTKDKEIIFFRDKHDMCKKIEYLLKNVDLRRKIENNSYKKLLQHKHSIIDRMKYFLSVVI